MRMVDKIHNTSYSLNENNQITTDIQLKIKCKFWMETFDL